MSGASVVTGVVATVLVGALLLGSCAGLGYVVGEGEAAGKLPEIEAVRADAAVVDPAQAEDVIGQVTEVNRDIASARALNATWWAGWFISDRWDDVEPIPVPR